jgi:cell division protein FtsB
MLKMTIILITTPIPFIIFCPFLLNIFLVSLLSYGIIYHVCSTFTRSGKCEISSILSYSVWGAYLKESDTNERWKSRESVLTELQGRESELQTEIDRLETAKGIEAEIRSKFEVAKEGEEVIVIVEPPKEDGEVITPEEKSFWERIFERWRD